MLSRRSTHALAVAVCIAGCGPSVEEGADTTAPGISDETLEALEGASGDGEALVSFTVPDDQLISGDGVGVAVVGSTLGALRDEIGDRPIRFEERFDQALSAVCVDGPDGSELFCAGFPRTAQPAAGTVITMARTRHPSFRTREGVGPGVSVEDAAVVYGEAYFVIAADGSGEFVEFDNGPPGTVAFRPLLPSDPQVVVGLYAEDAGGFQETEEYRSGALIGAVDVIEATAN